MSLGRRILAHPGLRAFWIATRFLSRLPVPDPGPPTPEELGRAVPWYPAVGLLLGLLLGAAAVLLGPAVCAAPPGVAAALVLGLWVWSTGALHLDGLADTADAWVGGLGDRERTLAIMKDPASGPVAVSVLGVLLIGKFAALETLIGGGGAWVLLWVPVLARAQLPVLLLTTPYARTEGMAAAPARGAPPRASILVVILTGVGLAATLGWVGLLLLGAASGVFWLVRRALLGRLGGFTGDTAGALVELTEWVASLALALLWRP